MPQFCYSLRVEMARLIWIARKFNRGMTYQQKAKDMVNAWGYLYGVANLVIYCYNAAAYNQPFVFFLSQICRV